MRGKRDLQEGLFSFVSLEKMVPSDRLLRLIERHVHLSFVDRELEPLYSALGRPSVDPQVLVRMMIVGYLLWYNASVDLIPYAARYRYKLTFQSIRTGLPTPGPGDLLHRSV